MHSSALSIIFLLHMKLHRIIKNADSTSYSFRFSFPLALLLKVT